MALRRTLTRHAQVPSNLSKDRFSMSSTTFNTLILHSVPHKLLPSQKCSSHPLPTTLCLVFRSSMICWWVPMVPAAWSETLWQRFFRKRLSAKRSMTACTGPLSSLPAVKLTWTTSHLAPKISMHTTSRQDPHSCRYPYTVWICPTQSGYTNMGS